MSQACSVLRRFELLRDLTDDELEILLNHTTPVTLKRGQHLFREGDPGEAMYFIHEGVVVVERVIDAAAGTHKDLAIVPPMSVVGDMAVADDEPRSATVRAELAVRALRLSRESFAKLNAESAATALKLMRALFVEASRRLRATNEELVVVYEVGRLVASTSDATAASEAVMRHLCARLDASYGVVALYERDSNTLRIRYAYGASADTLRGESIPLDDGIACRVFDEKRPMLVDRLLGATEAWESSSMVLAPLLVRDAARGLLLFGVAASGEPYSASQMTLVAAVANIAAPVMLDTLPLAVRG